MGLSTLALSMWVVAHHLQPHGPAWASVCEMATPIFQGCVRMHELSLRSWLLWVLSQPGDAPLPPRLFLLLVLAETQKSQQVALFPYGHRHSIGAQ